MYMKNLAILLVTMLATTAAYAQSSLGEYDVNGQPVNPSTLKPPSNVSKAQFQAETHVSLPANE